MPFPSLPRWLTGALLLAGCLGAAGLAWASWPQPEPPPQPAMPALAGALGAVDRLQIVHGIDTLVLERRGQLWFLAQHAGYPADSARANALLDGMARMQLIQPVPGNVDLLGLDDPARPGAAATLVRVMGRAGPALGAMVLGRTAPGGQYVRRPGEWQAWLADGTPSVDATLAGWADLSILSVDPAKVEGVTLSRADDSGPSVPGDAARGHAAAVILDDLLFTEVRAARQVHPVPLGQVKLALADGTAVSIDLGTAEKRLWLTGEATGPGADAINRKLRPWAFAVAPETESRLLPPVVP